MARKISRPAGRNRTASTPKTAVAASSRRRTREEEAVLNFFLGAALFVLAVVIFYPAFHAGFIWDDDQLLTANPQVHSADGWWTLWLKPLTADYFPLTSTTLWIEYHLGQFISLWNVEYLQRYGGPDTWNGYHIMNILFHATAVVLTWQVLKRLRIPGAWVAAAIFAVHPICVESVAWISERKNTISQIFFLLSIIHYVRFEEKGRMWRYVAAVICFTLALLAKTAVVMLPFILLLLAWWRYRDLEPLRESYELEKSPAERGILLWSCVAAGMIAGGSMLFLNPMLGAAGAIVGGGIGYIVGLQLRKLKEWESFAGFEVIRTIPFFLVAFVLGVVTVYFQYGRAIGEEVIPIGNWWQRSISACFAAGFYLYSALWPFNIIEIYPQWHRMFGAVELFPERHITAPAPEALSYWKQFLPGVFIAALLFWCWLRRTETWARAMLVGLGSYFLAMLPALGFLTMSYMRLTLVADHFQYISIIAVIALVVAAGFQPALSPADRARQRPPEAERRDSSFFILLRDFVRAYAGQLLLVGGALAFGVISWLNWDATQDNHIEEVIWIVGPIVLAAVSLQDEETWKWVWSLFIGTVLLCFCYISWNQAGIYQNEETLWSATLAKNPYTWQAHNHLGAALYMEGKIKEAFPHFLKATQLKPENPESHNNLGLVYSYFGMKDDAIREYELAVRIKDDSAMDTNLANAYEAVKRFPDAIKTYKHALEINPDNASAWCNMGYALMVEGKIDEAIPCFMKAIELDPGMPQGRSDLNQALRARGIDPEAPVLTGTYNFDVQKALEMTKKYPPPPPPSQQPPPQ
jgi:tetratricopeptide (TPR) repeat protein